MPIFNKTLLEVNGLSITFSQYGRGFQRLELPVIKDLHVRIEEGEVVAVIGSSGTGKSLLAHGIMGILPYNATMEGEIIYRGLPLDEKRICALRGKEIALVPQSISYLDPLMRVGEAIRKGKKDTASRLRGREVLQRYGLDESTEKLYPFELSGGMARRVLIAAAIMDNPRLIIADEPTPGLSESTAKRVLGHFREMADEGKGVLLISHDLDLALEIADRAIIFDAGI